MAVNDSVSVRFGAETSGVTTGGQAVKGVLGELQAAVAELSAAFRGTGVGAVAAFNDVKAGAASATASVKEGTEAVAGFRASIISIGQALIAAFAVKEVADFADGLAKTAEQNAHLTATFGLSTEAIQRLRAEAAGLGVNFDGRAKACPAPER